MIPRKVCYFTVNIIGKKHFADTRNPPQRITEDSAMPRKGFPSIDRNAVSGCNVSTACYDIFYTYILCVSCFCAEIQCFTAKASISTLAFFGSAATWKAARAGYGSAKYSP